MIRRVLFGLVLLLAVMPRIVHAQDCAPNMLQLSSQGSDASVADNPLLHFSTAFTFECWAIRDSSVGRGPLLLKRGTVAPYGLELRGDSVVGFVEQDSTRIEITAEVSNITTWHHYALLFRASDSLYLVVDSTDVAAVATRSSAIAVSSGALLIGADTSGVSLLGAMDDIRLWNIGRTASALRSTMSRVLQGSEVGLVAYYSADDDIGSARLHDFSRHHLDATLSGGGIAVVTSSSPVTTRSPGFQIDALERLVDLGVRRCSPSFDTVIHIRNMGTSTLEVNSVAPYRGQAFSVTSILPLTLEPDSTKWYPIRIHFSANRGGEFFDSLYISSTDPCAGQVLVGLHATYDSVGVTVSPNAIDLGSMLRCELPVVRTATVHNISGVDSVRIVTTSVAAGSGIRLVTPLPIVLAPNGSQTITIAIDTAARGAYSVNFGLELDRCSREGMLLLSGTRQEASLGVPDEIDFGTVNAQLDSVRRDTIVTIANTGDVRAQIRSVTSSDPALQVLNDVRRIWMEPGDTVQLRLRLNAASCGVIVDTLRIRGSVCNSDTAIVVRFDVLPPLALQSRPLLLGASCRYVDTVLWVRNPNATAIEIDTVAFGMDGIFFVRPGTFPRTVAPHDSTALDIRFNPGVAGDYLVTGFIQARPCSITPVQLGASWGINHVSVSPAALSFGRGCDVTPVMRTVTIVNGSSRDVVIVDTAWSGSARYNLSGFVLPFALRPGDSVTLDVHYSPVLGRLDTAQLLLLSQEGCPAATIALRGSRERPQLAALDPELRFDTTCPGSMAIATLHLLNGGLDSIDLVRAMMLPVGYSVQHMPRAIASGAMDSIVFGFVPSATREYADVLAIPYGECGDTLFIPTRASGGPTTALIALSDTLDFGTVAVGDSVVRCLTLSNPSCAALLLRDTNYRVDAGPFAVQTRPASDTVSLGRSTFVCLNFVPPSYGAFSSVLHITPDGVAPVDVVLRGVGVAPDVKIAPTSLDFGFVLVGETDTLQLSIANVGNATAYLSYGVTSAAFHVVGPDSVQAGEQLAAHVIFTPQTANLLVHAFATVAYGGKLDSVALLGEGIGGGLRLSTTGVEFGAVHVHGDSTTTIALTAASDFPTITAIDIADTAHFHVSTSVPLPYSIQRVTDTLFATITYQPNAEQADATVLRVTTNAGDVTAAIHGMGVQEHIRVNAVSIDFGDVELGQSQTLAAVIVGNSGGYPLQFDSIRAAAFQVSPDLSHTSLVPAATDTLSLRFSPMRARVYNDTLRIYSSAPEGEQDVVLRGRGVYPISERPEFTYHLSSASLRSGDTTAIAVTVSGVRMEHLDVDSTTIVIRFDPTMMRVLDVHAATLRSWRVVDDSTLRATLDGAPTTTGSLCTIVIQALLGTHPVTAIAIQDASPKADFAALSTDGTLTVTDCDGTLHGVVFAGSYQIDVIRPNPATSTATLRYLLGWDGGVTIRLYNALGIAVQTVALGRESRGAHTYQLDVHTLPAGTYRYEIESLDFRASGALLIQR